MDAESLIQPVILITGVLGAILNAKQIIYGFHIWIGCNVLLIYSSVQHGQHGMAVLYVFYTAVCLFGIFNWRNKVEA